ncbi:Glycosyl transferase family 11 [uncultured archaeon]|nr:Glycosyl transferase family 11 [uncultured archaeon]
MITVMLMGGMGNQLFQWVMGLEHSRRFNTELVLDTTHLRGKRSYALDQWEGINERTVTGSQRSVTEQTLPYSQHTVNQISDGSVLQGYWQSEKYFTSVQNDFRHLLVPRDKSFMNMDVFNAIVKEPLSVSVHVRRGDYLVSPHREFHGVLDMDYYTRSMNLMKNKLTRIETRRTGLLQEKVTEETVAPKFFVFSDDPEWTRSNFTGKDIVHVQPSTESIDIYLMGMCKNAIVANSSFSWWGAQLAKNDGQMVVAPYKWFGKPEDRGNARDIVPERWFRQ